MGAVDTKLVLRDGTTDFTSTGNGSWVDLGAANPSDLAVVTMNAPQVATGTSPTCDMIIESSDDGSNAYGDKFQFKQLTASNTPGEFKMKIPFNHRYIRWNATLGGSASPTFPKLYVGVEFEDVRALRPAVAGTP